MKKAITCLLLAAGLTGHLSAQIPVQSQSDKNSGKVIRMDKQMFLDNIFDYTSGSTDWKYKGEKPAVIDFYATWCGPCRMVAPLLKSLAKEYQDQIIVYKVDTDKQKVGRRDISHSILRSLSASANKASYFPPFENWPMRQLRQRFLP